MTPLSQTILAATGDFIIYDDELISAPSPRLFDPNEWGEKATPHAEGRGTVWFIEQPDGEWILKNFRRGGLVGRFIKQRYFFSGNRRTRMAQRISLVVSASSNGFTGSTTGCGLLKEKPLFLAIRGAC
jgi:3-deoxy-D-manno-octulosonic acid kinase